MAVTETVRLAENLHERSASLSSLFDRLDGAGPLMHNLMDGLRDSRRIVVAAEKHIAADKGATDVRTGTHAADEIFDRAARLAGRLATQQQNGKRGRLGNTGEIGAVGNLQPNLARG